MPSDPISQASQLSTARVVAHNWQAIRRFVIYLSTVVFTVYCTAIFYEKVVMPIFIAAFLAYLMIPLVDQLEKKKINRSLATLLILLLIFGVLTGLVIRLFPFLYDQLIGLVQQVPALIDNLARNAGFKLRELLRESGIRDNGAIEKAFKGFNIVEQGIARLQMAAQGVFDVSAGVMGSLVNIVLVPVLSFYFVVEKSRIVQGVRKITPRDIRPYGITTVRVIDETITNVIRGHIKVAATLACLYSIGFTAIGLSAGLAIGIAAGMCRVIPYLDIAVGLTLGVTYIFTQGIPTITVFWLVGVIGTIQILDGVLITPKLIGNKVGLHPMVVILTVIASSAQFGFLGVLLAIPCAALVKAFYKIILPVYRDSKWFTGEK